MNWLLRQSTASQEIRLGTFLDDTDGKTAETGLTIANTDIKISKAGTTTEANKNSGGATHIASGRYYAVLDATDTDTLGSGEINVSVAGALPVKLYFTVLTAEVYDSLVAGTDNLGVDVTQLNGVSQSLLDLKDFADEGYDPAINKVQGVVLTDTLTTYTGNTPQTGDNYPETSVNIPSAISAIGSVGGAGRTIAASSFTLTTGSYVSGAYTDTSSLGTNFVHNDSAGTFEGYYEFDIGLDGVPASTKILVTAQGSNDPLELRAYEWGTTTWKVIGNVASFNVASEQTLTPSLLTSYVGTGANAGLVRIGLYGVGLTSATISVNYIEVSHTISTQSSAYFGALWLDTIDGTAGSVVNTNGTAFRPVDNIPDLLTLSASTKLKRVNVAPGSTMTLASSATGLVGIGEAWTLSIPTAQDISNSYIRGATISGTASSPSGETNYVDCEVGNFTVDDAHFEHCGLEGTLTLNGVASTVKLINCYSLIAGPTTPVLDFGVSVGINHQVTIAGYHNGIQIDNYNASGTDTLSLEGVGKLIVSATSSGAIQLRGNWTVVNTGGATLVKTDEATSIELIDANVDLIKTSTDNLPADPASETNVDANETKIDTVITNISALNDVAATDIVSAGAITTLAGAVVNVDLVDVTTTNTDMRGTDSALLAVSAPTNFGDMSITATTGKVTVGTNDDKTSYSISGTKTTLDALNDISTTDVNTEVDTALTDIGLDHLVSASVTGTDVIDNSIIAQMVSKSVTADWDTYDNTTDSSEATRDRGDATWVTGGGGAIGQVINVQPIIPFDIDLANTATFRVGLMLLNSVDDLPSVAEIVPGTVSIEKKALGATSWSAIVTDAAMSEIAGLVYYDEVFDSGTGYAEGDSIRITFKNVKVTADANDHEVVGATGRSFYSSIRQTMRGTDSAATAASLATAQADLDIITDTDGVIIGTASIAAQTTATWTDTLTSYTDGQAGKRLRSLTPVPVVEGLITGTNSPTVFTTDVTGYGDDHFNSVLLEVETGVATDWWQGRIVADYVSATGQITIEEALTFSPLAGARIVLQHTHTHTLAEIGTAAREDMDANSTKLSAIETETLSHPTLAEIEGSSILAKEATIAALNDLSTADIDARLTAYGIPTLTEMTSAFTEIKGAGWTVTDTLEAIRDFLTTVNTNVDSNETKIDTLTTNVAALNDISVVDILTTTMTEGYSGANSEVTLAQALYEVLAVLLERTNSGTTATFKQRDGATTAFTGTMNDALNPTSITRN